MKHLSALLISATLLLSCATPSPISKLTSVDQKHTYWNNGSEVISQTKDSISVEISFYEKQNDLFIFDATVVNQRNKSITIDPLQFSYIPISIKGDTLETITSFNPESEILNQQMKISRLEADRKNQLSQLLIFGSIELAADLSNNYDENEYKENHHSPIESYEREVSRIDFRKLNTLDQKEYWENQSLRKTTLFTDYYTSGKIFLSYRKGLKMMGLIFSIEDQQFEFWFDHELIPY